MSEGEKDGERRNRLALTRKKRNERRKESNQARARTSRIPVPSIHPRKLPSKNYTHDSSSTTHHNKINESADTSSVEYGGELKKTCEEYNMRSRISNLEGENVEANNNQVDLECEIPIMEVGSNSSCTSSGSRTVSPLTVSNQSNSSFQSRQRKTRERLHQLAQSNPHLEQDGASNVFLEAHQVADTRWAFNDSPSRFELQSKCAREHHDFIYGLNQSSEDLWRDHSDCNNSDDLNTPHHDSFSEKRADFVEYPEKSDDSDQSLFKKPDVTFHIEKKATELTAEHVELCSGDERGECRPKRDENRSRERSDEQILEYTYSLPAELEYDSNENSGMFWDEIDVESAIDEGWPTDDVPKDTSGTSMAPLSYSKESVQTLTRKARSMFNQRKVVAYGTFSFLALFTCFIISTEKGCTIKRYVSARTLNIPTVFREACSSKNMQSIRAHFSEFLHALYAALKVLYSVFYRLYAAFELGMHEVIGYLTTLFQTIDNELNVLVMTFVERVMQFISSWSDPGHDSSEHFVANVSGQTRTIDQNATRVNDTTHSDFIWIFKETEKIKHRRIQLENVLEAVLLETQTVLKQSCNDTKTASFAVMKQLKTDGYHTSVFNMLRELSEYEDIVSTHTSLLQKEIDIIRSRQRDRERSYEHSTASTYAHQQQCFGLETFRDLLGKMQGMNDKSSINWSTDGQLLHRNGETAESKYKEHANMGNVGFGTDSVDSIKKEGQRVAPVISSEEHFSFESYLASHMTMKTLRRVSAFSLFTFSVFFFSYLRHRQSLSRKRQALHPKRWQKRMSDSAIMRSADDDVLEFIPARAPVHPVEKPLSMSTHVRRSHRIATAQHARYSAP